MSPRFVIYYSSPARCPVERSSRESIWVVTRGQGAREREMKAPVPFWPSWCRAVPEVATSGGRMGLGARPPPRSVVASRNVRVKESCSIAVYASSRHERSDANCDSLLILAPCPQEPQEGRGLFPCVMQLNPFSPSCSCGIRRVASTVWRIPASFLPGEVIVTLQRH